MSTGTSSVSTTQPEIGTRDLRRESRVVEEQDSPPIWPLVSSVGLYAAAGLAQRGVAFFLIPLYTRLIDPAEYGHLEILNAFSAIVFACMALGLRSAVNKCYHRDCKSTKDKASVLVTATLVDLPLLLVGGAILLVFAGPLSEWLVGSHRVENLLPLVVGSGILSSLAGLGLATLRAQERAVAFSLLTLTQFLVAITLNVILIAGYQMGIQGILWANLLSNAALLPLALAAARRGSTFTLNRALVAPLLRFGLLLVPAMLAGWVMDLSDRWVLRLYGDFEKVAVYGIGYKVGMALQLAVVWPFQLAWPAFSFSISHQQGHRATYARTLTYFSLILVFLVLLISLMARPMVTLFVGEGYRSAYRVVPLVTLAYAFQGIHYCLSPGIHISRNTKYLPILAVISALANLGLNFFLIPRLGMMGAAWSTVAAFLLLAVMTGVLVQRVYPVRYEYVRLAKLVAAGVVLYIAATTIAPQAFFESLAWYGATSVIGFPVLLLMVGFFAHSEWAAFLGLLRRPLALLR